MKKFSFLLLVSIFLALIVNTILPDSSFEEQLIRIQARQELGGSISTIEDESIEIQSVLLDYSDHEELVLKIQLAMMKYPYQTRELLEMFGSKAEFREIILLYGDSVIPVINYFLTTELNIFTKVMNGVSHYWHGTKKYIGRKFGNNEETEEAPKPVGKEDLAWNAILVIKDHGHNILGQFVTNTNGEVKRSRIEQYGEAILDFLTGGLKNVEIRYLKDQDIRIKDLAMAGVDVAIVGGFWKLLRSGKLIVLTGKSVRVMRTSLFGSRLLKSGFAGRTLKYSSVAATAFVVLKHPTLITSAFAEVGRLIGIPPMLAQMIGIALLAFVLLYPFSWLMKIFIRPAITVVKWLLMILMNIEKRFRGQVSTHDSTGSS